jgi:hypothetical protein
LEFGVWGLAFFSAAMIINYQKTFIPTRLFEMHSELRLYNAKPQTPNSKRQLLL